MAYWGEAMTFNHPIWMQQDLKPRATRLTNWHRLRCAPNQGKDRPEKEYFDGS